MMASNEITELKTIMCDIGRQVQGLTNKLDHIEEKFTGMLSAVQQDVDHVKKDMETTKKEVRSLSTNYSELERGVQAMDNQLQELEMDKMVAMRQELEKKIAKLNEKHLLLEKHERKYNLFIYGVSQDKNEEKSGSVMERLHKFFVDDLGISKEKAKEIPIANAHRVPSRARDDRPNPIIVRFLYHWDKQYVLSLGSKLAKKKIRMLDDLPVPMKEARGSLANTAYHIRQDEKLQTRIKVDGVCVSLETRLNTKDKWQKRKEINVAASINNE